MGNKILFDTLDEMIQWAIKNGATHISFGNYHDGSFWKAEKPNEYRSYFHYMHFSAPHYKDDILFNVNKGWMIWDKNWHWGDVFHTYSYWNGAYPIFRINDISDNDFNKYKENARICHDVGRCYDTKYFHKLFR